MIILTARGALGAAYLNQFDAEVASLRELPEDVFTQKLRQAKTIIHNAATINCNGLEDALTQNFDFTRYLVQKIQDVNPEVYLIMVSSMSVLDPNNDQLYGNVLQMTPYGYSKYLAETFCLKSSLKNVSCVRFSTLFYEDPKRDGLSKLIDSAVRTNKITIYDKGLAKRNFLPLKIAVEYLHKIVDQAPPDKPTYNLCAERSTSFSDIINILKKHFPKLEVENKFLAKTVPVLSEFKNDNIVRLGKIGFSLEDEINNYIARLQA